MRLQINHTVYEIEDPKTLIDVKEAIQSQYKHPILAFKIGNHLYDIREKIQNVKHLDENFHIVDINDSDGIRIYQRTLSYIFIRAVHEVFPNSKVEILHSISNGLYCTIDKKPAFAEIDIDLIINKMNKLISIKEPFEKIVMSKEEAVKFYFDKGEIEKSQLIDTSYKANMSMYQYGGMLENFYGYMALDAGDIGDFDLIYYKEGVILAHPQFGTDGKVPEFKEHRKRSEIFRESENWGKILKIANIFNINKAIETGSIKDQILINEGLHEKKIAKIADNIYHANKRVILIAGPSSSGKTTFANRLRIQLMVHGLNPIALGTDDYYIDRDKLPLMENGEPDLETIDAINLQKFNQDISDLLQGKEITMPEFDFKVGKSKEGKKIQIESNQPIIIEGIHGLNPKLTRGISGADKFKIYISCLTQLNIDGYNRIPTTDSRLIRRIVRDFKYRGTPPVNTLKMWDSVRAGEEKYIFPFQEDADDMFNSALTYELNIFKKYIYDELAKITDDEGVYLRARRLMNILNYVVDSHDENVIPNTSILREFIGGNIFHGN